MIFQINTLNEKVKQLEARLKSLEDEKNKLAEGQLIPEIEKLVIDVVSPTSPGIGSENNVTTIKNMEEVLHAKPN